MRSLFRKFKEGLKKQTPTFHKAFEGIFSGAKLDPAALEELEELLYTADFGVETVEEIISAIEVAYKANKELRGEAAAKIGATVLTQVLEGAEGRVTIGPASARGDCFDWRQWLG
jgi:fused signal recognition particle receptor